MPNRPTPGIRQRRREAVRQAIECCGWKARGTTGARADLYSHQDHPKADLLAGDGGALYWTRRNTLRITRKARATDSPDVKAALDAGCTSDS